MADRVDEQLDIFFYRNERSSWRDATHQLATQHLNRAKALLKRLVLMLLDEEQVVVRLSLFEYPELDTYVVNFVVKQAQQSPSSDDDKLAAFLWQLKEEKLAADALRPLAESIWLPSLQQDIFKRKIWRCIEEDRHTLIQDFLIDLGRRLAQPPHKVALSKLSDDRINEIILEVSSYLVEKSHFSADDVEQIYEHFLEQESAHTHQLKAKTFARGIGANEKGPLKLQASPLTHLLTGTNIQTALSTLESDSFVRMGVYHTGRHDTSFAAFSEPESLPKLLSDPLVTKIFIPAGDGGHWRAVILEKKRDTLELSLFDSFGAESACLIELEIRELVNHCLDLASETVSLSKKTNYITPRHLQTNWYSCGHYVVAYAHHLFKQDNITGFDDKVAAAFNKPQQAITKIVVDYHDRFYETPASPLEEAGMVEPKKPSAARQPVLAAMPQKPKKRENPFLRPKPASSVTTPKKGEDEYNFHLFFGGKVSPASEDTHQRKARLRKRADVKALQAVIDNMKESFHDSCWFWLRIASVTKANALQNSLDAFIEKEAAESQHVLNDADIAKSVDSYRYFGFFNRLIHKKTNTRLALEQVKLDLAQP